ncbi:hypothetical protein B0H11DRAFT_1966308 [Mycena galericulata]|nr:hypothetical protein B0H11DRAFT_1966308 [Mycena galericulata]
MNIISAATLDPVQLQEIRVAEPNTLDLRMQGMTLNSVSRCTPTSGPNARGRSSLDEQIFELDRIPPPPPIDILPYELLAEIMILALVTPRPAKWDPQRMVPAPAAEILSLCEVCARWRQIIIQIPQLWVLHDFPLMNYRHPTNVALAATAKFLERSAPLPISVDLTSAYYLRQEMDIISSLGALSGVADRWKSLTIMSAVGETEAAALAQIPVGRLDTLEKLHLMLCNPDIWQIADQEIFLSTPRLRDLTLNMRDSSQVLSMPWAQLTQLSLTCASPQSCLDILAQCTNIVSAKVYTKQWVTDMVPIAATAALKHLEVLEIHMDICSMGEHLAPFLQRLRLPVLISLSLSLNFTFSSNHEWFVSWLAPELEDFLTCHLAPKLETLELSELGVQFTESSLGEMIRSRWWSDDELLAMPTPPGVARLKRFALQWSDMCDYPNQYEFTREFVETMAVYRSQGLDIDGIY